MKNKILKTILSSSVAAASITPVFVTSSCAYDTKWTGDTFVDWEERAGCPSDEYSIPEAKDLIEKEGVKYFGLYEASTFEWYKDEACTEPADDMGVVPDVEAGSILVRYAKTTLEFDSEGVKPVTIVKPLKIRVVTTEPVDFKTDDWCTIFYHSRQGLSHLREAYGTTSFIGMERKVPVNGLEHTVRVIGQSHDQLASGSGYAPLTFEFANLISIKEQGKISCSTCHWKSYRNYQTSFSSILSNVLSGMPDSLVNGIRMVRKTMYYTKSSAVWPLEGAWEYTTFSTQLFLLSRKELSGSGRDDGSRYTYYSQHSSNSDRIKKDLNGNAIAYWTRTPEPAYWAISGFPEEGYYVTKSGSIDVTGLTDTASRGISPAFCI